jgi:hypothetical protein
MPVIARDDLIERLLPARVLDVKEPELLIKCAVAGLSKVGAEDHGLAATNAGQAISWNVLKLKR